MFYLGPHYFRATILLRRTPNAKERKRRIPSRAETPERGSASARVIIPLSKQLSISSSLSGHEHAQWHLADSKGVGFEWCRAQLMTRGLDSTQYTSSWHTAQQNFGHSTPSTNKRMNTRIGTSPTLGRALPSTRVSLGVAASDCVQVRAI